MKWLLVKPDGTILIPMRPGNWLGYWGSRDHAENFARVKGIEAESVMCDFTFLTKETK